MPECGFCGKEFHEDIELKDHIESIHRKEAKAEMKSGDWKKKHLAVKYSFSIKDSIAKTI